jgi:lysophospholipase L1-like esterase
MKDQCLLSRVKAEYCVIKKNLLIKFFLFFIIMILACELILRLIGFILIDGKFVIGETISNREIRILTLGESTTDKSYQTINLKAWPEYLEQLAIQHNYKIKVYNFGKAAITTNEILNNLDEILDHYRPHVVITMMGINDSNSWTVDINQSIFKDIKTYRLLTWIIWRCSTILSYKPLPFKKFDTVYADIEKMDAKLKSQYYAFLSSQVVASVPLPNNISDHDGKYKRSTELLRLSLDSGEFVQGVLGQYTWMLINSKQFNECSNIIKAYIKKGGVLNYFELMNSQECFSVDENNLNNLNKNQDNLAFSLSNKDLFGNYKKIHRKIIAKGAIHLIVQYPNLSNSTLRKIFKENSSTYHVENLENFKLALSKHKRNEIFLDDFAGDFGHTTAMGHRLISQEIFKQLSKILEKISY